MVKEQASAKTDLGMGSSKLENLTEHVCVPEEKLQNAFNENAILWRGLESKFSSTKTLCDRLTKTVQLLAGQVQDGEKGDDFFKNRISDMSVTLDNLQSQMESLSLWLESLGEETIKKQETDLTEVSKEKEERERHLNDEKCRVASLIEEKYKLIKSFKETAVANESIVERLISKLKEMHLLKESKENTERAKTDHIRVLEEKLQNAFNENVKLRRGLESKFSSTKTLCDQLTKTVQLLAGQVQDGEKGEDFFKKRISETSVTLDNLQSQMESVSSWLESSGEETIKKQETELKEVSKEKEERERHANDEKCIVASLIEEKDNKNFKETAVLSESTVDRLNSKLKEMHLYLRAVEDDLKVLKESMENTEKEKTDLLLCNKSFSNKLDMAMQKIKNLKDSVNKLAEKLTEFDNQSLTFAEKIAQLNALFDSCFKLVQEENVLATQYAWRQYHELHHQFVLELVIQDLKSKVGELQKEQEPTIGQHAEEGRLAEERTQKLEYVAERLSEMETLIATLEEKITTSLRLSEENMNDLMLRFSELEIENQVNSGNLLSEIQKKEEEICILKEQIEKQKQRVNLVADRVEQLNGELKKDNLISKYNQKEIQDETAQTDKLPDAGDISNAAMKSDLIIENTQSEIPRCSGGSILPLQSENANLVTWKNPFTKIWNFLKTTDGICAAVLTFNSGITAIKTGGKYHVSSAIMIFLSVMALVFAIGSFSLFVYLLVREKKKKNVRLKLTWKIWRVMVYDEDDSMFLSWQHLAEACCALTQLVITLWSVWKVIQKIVAGKLPTPHEWVAWVSMGLGWIVSILKVVNPKPKLYHNHYCLKPDTYTSRRIYYKRDIPDI